MEILKFRDGGGHQNLRGKNMPPGYICMDKIIILWSDCESWESKCLSSPPCSASPELFHILILIIVMFAIASEDNILNEDQDLQGKPS